MLRVYKRDPYRFWFAALILAAAVLRAFYLYSYRQNVIFSVSPVGDAKVFADLAAGLIQFDFFRSDFVFYSTLYSILIAVMKFITGTFRSTYIFQSLLGIVNLILVFRITERVLGKKAALIAGAIFLFSPGFIFLETKLNPSTLSITLILCGIYYWIKSRDGKWIVHLLLAVLCLTLLCLLIPFYLSGLILIMVVASIFWPAEIVSSKGRWLFSLAVAFLFITPLLGWHWMINERPMPFQRSTAIDLYINNFGAAAEGPSPGLRSEATYHLLNRYTKALKGAENESKTIISPDELGSYYASKVVKLALEKPSMIITQTVTRFLFLFSPLYFTDDPFFRYESRKCLPMNLAFISPSLIILLGLSLLFFRPSIGRNNFFTLAMGSWTMLYHILVRADYGSSMLLMAVALPFAAGAIERILNLVTKRPLSITIAFLLAGTILLNIITFASARRVATFDRDLVFNIGKANEYIRLYPAAFANYTALLKEEPKNAIYLESASITALKGQMYDQAESILKYAIKVYPDMTNSYNNIAVVYMNTGRDEEAARNLRISIERQSGNYRALYNLGFICKRWGRYVEAEASLKKIPPDSDLYWKSIQMLGELRSLQKDYKGALAYYKMLHQRFPKEPFFEFKIREFRKILVKK